MAGPPPLKRPTSATTVQQRHHQQQQQQQQSPLCAFDEFKPAHSIRAHEISYLVKEYLKSLGCNAAVRAFLQEYPAAAKGRAPKHRQLLPLARILEMYLELKSRESERESLIAALQQTNQLLRQIIDSNNDNKNNMPTARQVLHRHTDELLSPSHRRIQHQHQYQQQHRHQYQQQQQQQQQQQHQQSYQYSPGDVYRDERGRFYAIDTNSTDAIATAVESASTTTDEDLHCIANASELSSADAMQVLVGDQLADAYAAMMADPVNLADTLACQWNHVSSAINLRHSEEVQIQNDSDAVNRRQQQQATAYEQVMESAAVSQLIDSMLPLPPHLPPSSPAPHHITAAAAVNKKRFKITPNMGTHCHPIGYHGGTPPPPPPVSEDQEYVTFSPPQKKYKMM
ncbi:MAG: hypothetical protein WC763_06200 [Candidatus Paceibacterota bacterium]|jgi:hypothetical protein